MKKTWKLVVLALLGVSLTLIPTAVHATLTPSSVPSSAEVSSAAQPELTPTTQDTASSLEAGRQFYAAGQFADAIAAWQAAVAASTASGDTLQQALGLSYLSSAYQALNQWDAAQDAINQSLNLLEQANPPASPVLRAQALNTKASLLLDLLGNSD
jgi:tetratricopeptide (TPR) repeat protein